MAWLTVDKDGTENLSLKKPLRQPTLGYWLGSCYSEIIELEPGSVVELIHRKITWEDEPVEI